jgi:hypothetical protein
MRVTAVGIGNLGLALALLCVCAGCELSRTLQSYQRFITAGGVRGVEKSVCPAPAALPFKTH